MRTVGKFIILAGMLLPMHVHADSTTVTKIITDETIAKNVSATLSSLKRTNKIDVRDDLQVQVSDGQVTISGTVADNADITTIKKALIEAEGIKSSTVDVSVTTNPTASGQK